MLAFYGNISTGYLTQFLVVTLSMYYFFNFRHKVWRDYNHLTAAAFNTGYNSEVCLMFIIFSSGKPLKCQIGRAMML